MKITSQTTHIAQISCGRKGSPYCRRMTRSGLSKETPPPLSAEDSPWCDTLQLLHFFFFLVIVSQSHFYFFLWEEKVDFIVNMCFNEPQLSKIKRSNASLGDPSLRSQTLFCPPLLLCSYVRGCYNPYALSLLSRTLPMYTQAPLQPFL